MFEGFLVDGVVVGFVGLFSRSDRRWRGSLG